MHAIRKILKVENNQLQIDLPKNLFSGLVEVIILPFKSKEENNEVIQKNNELNDFQKLLLSGPIMSQEELKFFTDKKSHFNQWK
ncbi:MAG: hypothetical protein R3E32_29640 [Chitinophagales bacterium]